MKFIVGSVQGAIATWSVIGFLELMVWTRSLSLPVLTRSKNDC